jgi:shikimate 5-dehydrogenase
MLLRQGAIAFELFTGKKAPVKAMEKALLKHISQK